ncbi:Hypothetical predicted protein [Mytilus galloprovincialis]|uniref:Reverse transcriptase domain-containing protein n=1 Tax=Mytilus galloprovincialis TaxID=29158 RepID=A0A8B6GMW8_MYTGA|nr:Hypothetical predicted protein [Mytilus galloprovincialis]
MEVLPTTLQESQQEISQTQMAKMEKTTVRRFKYEDTRLARENFHQHDFLYGYDLKSAYHHIEIVELHREYLGFAWEIDGANRYFVFHFLPFGLATAGYIFTKVLREVVKYIRSKGTQMIMFLDDGLGGGKDFES